MRTLQAFFIGLLVPGALVAMCAHPRLVERQGKPIEVQAPQAARQCAEHPELLWCHHAEASK